MSVTLEVFDPPLCCATGVCGPGVDPALAQFAADLDWLKERGVAVERFNLAQQPAPFASRPPVKDALAETGLACLPLILVDGHIVSRGVYPSRKELAGRVGVALPLATLALAPEQGTCGGESSCC